MVRECVQREGILDVCEWRKIEGSIETGEERRFQDTLTVDRRRRRIRMMRERRRR